MIPRFPTALRPGNRVLVFARVPEKGLVKTRLARSVGEDRALEVYKAMLADLLESVGPSDDQVLIEVLWTASDGIEGSRVLEAFGDHILARQAGKNLGERLVVAFSERVIFYNARKVIAIGTDLPTLRRHEIEVALKLLDSCEYVIGPATDGGYYLIGCRGPSFHPSIFEGVDWGSESVYETTIDHIRSLGETVALLPVRSDLDHEADLRRFLSRPEADGTRTARILREWESEIGK